MYRCMIGLKIFYDEKNGKTKEQVVKKVKGK